MAFVRLSISASVRPPRSLAWDRLTYEYLDAYDMEHTGLTVGNMSCYARCTNGQTARGGWRCSSWNVVMVGASRDTVVQLLHHWGRRSPRPRKKRSAAMRLACTTAVLAVLGLSLLAPHTTARADLSPPYITDIGVTTNGSGTATYYLCVQTSNPPLSGAVNVSGPSG